MRQALEALNKPMKGSNRFFRCSLFYLQFVLVFVAWYSWYRRGGHFGVFHCQFLLLSWRVARGVVVWDQQWGRRWSLPDSTSSPHPGSSR